MSTSSWKISSPISLRKTKAIESKSWSSRSERGSGKPAVFLALLRNDTHPKLCPIRALLLLLARTGITSGYLFGSKQEVDAIELDGCTVDSFKSSITYEEFSRVFVGHCDEVTHVDCRGRYGTHSLRKTGYVLAIWGGGCLDDIRVSARHKTIESAERYYRDASYLFFRAQRCHSSLLDLIPVWHSIMVENIQGAPFSC